jgi:hypothetical protein
LLRKVIRYTNFNDEEVEEVFYFHLTKAELVEFQLSVNDEQGMYGHIERIVAEENRPELIKLFKSLLLMSYGKRSEDGRRFTKNPQVIEDFVSTGAYSAVLIDILSSTESALEFYRGILPGDLSAVEAEEAGINPKVTPLMVVEKEKEKIPHNELGKMDREKLGEAMSRIAEGSAEIIYSDSPESQ